MKSRCLLMLQNGLVGAAEGRENSRKQGKCCGEATFCSPDCESVICNESNKEILNGKSFHSLPLEARVIISKSRLYRHRRDIGGKRWCGGKVRMECINSMHQDWGILQDKQLSMILREEDACGREVCWPGEPRGGRRESEILLREKVQNKREIFQAEWWQ